MRIGIVISHGFATRELLYSGIASSLQQVGHEVSLLVGSKLVADVGDWAQVRNMQTTVIDDVTLFREYYWHQFRKQLFLRYRPTLFLRLNNNKLRREHPVVDRIFGAGTWLLLARPSLQSLYCSVERTIYRTPILARKVLDLGLNLVIVTTPGLYIADLRVLRALRRTKNPTMCVLLNWDILTTKGLFPERVDRWTVWSETGRQELINLHGYRPEQIEVCGVAHFDIYADPSLFGSRDTILRRMGLEPRARTVFVGLNHSAYYQDQPGLIRDVAATLARIDIPSQIICRVHPQFAPTDFIGILRTVLQDSEVPFYLDVPKLHQATVDGRVHEQDALQLARALCVSDVSLSIASTLALDALALDKPVVNIGYDVHGIPQASGLPAADLYDYPHYSKLMDTGAVKVAWSREELERYIVDYLNEPGLDSEQRRYAVKQFLYKVDGHAKDRIVNAIIRFAAASRLHESGSTK